MKITTENTHLESTTQKDAGERQHWYSIHSGKGRVELNDLHGEKNLYDCVYKKKH